MARVKTKQPARRCEHSISKRAFKCLVREVLHGERKITDSALELLQNESEAYLGRVFRGAGLVCKCAGMSQLHVKHMQCVGQVLLNDKD